MVQENTQEEIEALDKPLPFWFLIMIPVHALGLLALMLFPFVKIWSWFKAWAFIITFARNITVSYTIINKENPRVLRNPFILTSNQQVARLSHIGVFPGSFFL